LCYSGQIGCEEGVKEEFNRLLDGEVRNVEWLIMGSMVVDHIKS